MKPDELGSGERLDSWKDISAYLGRDVRTVVRWEKERGLPVHRIPGGQRHGVFAYRHELDGWLAGAAQSNGSDPTPPIQPSTTPATSRSKLTIYLSIAIFTALLLLVAGYWNLTSQLALHSPQLLPMQQLTTNGLEKRGLLTDGKTLYFGQETNGWFALAAMSVDGGSIRILWNPTLNVIPADLSPDGSKLLAFSSAGKEKERELWIVPLDKGEPRKLDKITAHAAAWAPDNKTIAYAAGNKIFLVTEAETTPKEIGSFAGLPWTLFWTQNGQQLRFMLADASTQKAGQWGLISGEGMRTITTRPLSQAMIQSESDSRCRVAADAYMLEAYEFKPEITHYLLVQYNNHWWEPPIKITAMQPVLGKTASLACTQSSSRVFGLTAQQSSTAYVKFDSRHQSLQPLLPGISGYYLDYSRDGKWIVYNSSRDGSLWLARADGSGTRQITFPPENVELPRWSPDGKEIAFMAQHDGGPWRIHVLNIESGKEHEASQSDDSQGAPTWSPDGRFLAYGNVMCEHTNSCAIRIIDLTTGSVRTVPESEGFFTARWSPDGRFIAALNLSGHQLMLFNVKTEKWQKLTDGIVGSDLSWSSDSKYLFANLPGTDASIIRISVVDGKRQTVLDLHKQDALDMTQIDDLPFSLAPDDSVILHRRIHAHEIYAYELKEQ